MADFENILPPPGIETGIPNSLQGPDMVFVDGMNSLPPGAPLVPYNEDVSIPAVPTGGFEVNYNKKHIKTIDLFGRRVLKNTNQPLFYIYDDGSVEKQIIIE